MEEIELNFRLDREGRTAPSLVQETESASNAATIDYKSKTALTSLSKDDVASELVDDLLFDAEIADSGLMPRTFWVSSNAKPRFTMEQFALDVFNHHVPPDYNFDPEKSGAEWWVQIRPSPEKTGRYAMHAPSAATKDGEENISQTGISFHWDKDEELRLLTGGTTYIHPHLSTVTYLADLGCPTVALNCRVNNLTGDWITPAEDVQSLWSWPKRGKHLSFDGRYLHAALPNMMQEGQFNEQCTFTPSGDSREDKKAKRRHRRVTLLVNVWLHYIPFGVKSFPDTMVDKMSGYHEGKTIEKLEFLVTKHDDDNNPTDPSVAVVAVDEETHAETGTSSSYTNFTWPMGDCSSNEFIHLRLPLQTVRAAQKTGSDVDVSWPNHKDGSSFRMFKKEDAKTTSPAREDAARKREHGTADESLEDNKRSRQDDC